MSNVIKVWALGGVSAKIAQRLRKSKISGDGITPQFSYAYIDTSESSLTYLPSNQELDLIKTADGITGSGGNTGRNYKAAREQLPSIITNRKVEKAINFVIFSTGGGSGSMLGFTTIQNLIAQGESVVAFISNTTDTMSRTHNAMTSISNLDRLAQQNKCIIPAFIYDTTNSSNFIENDVAMVEDICLTAAMLSNTVVDLDEMDRRTVLNPLLSGKESVEPGVMALRLFEGMEYKETSPVVSALTLVDEGHSDNIGTDAPFIFSGILSPEFKATHLNDTSPNAISLLVSEASLNEWVSTINHKLESQKKARDSRYRGAKIAVTDKVKTNEAEDGFQF